MKTKGAIRDEIRKRLRGQSPKEQAEKDEAITVQFLSLPEFKKARVISCYLSIPSEVDTTEIIDKALMMDKSVVIPSSAGEKMKMYDLKDCRDQLVKGPYGVLQPESDRLKPYPDAKIDLVIVPGLAFTKGGDRLGRGKGYYDKYLSGLSKTAKKIGLAYDVQIVDELPTTQRDIQVDIVVTN